MIKEDKKPIEYLAPEATAAILSAYGLKMAKHRRNRMILILLYDDSGARVQELADLMVSSLHIDVANPYITLVGKGRKSHNVPLMSKTVKHLKTIFKSFILMEMTLHCFIASWTADHTSFLPTV